jgi:hypothetical protein
MRPTLSRSGEALAANGQPFHQFGELANTQFHTEAIHQLRFGNLGQLFFEPGDTLVSLSFLGIQKWQYLLRV